MTATDWDGFALQLAVWSTDAKHTPLSWRVIVPGTSGSLEERQTMDGYLAARDSGAYTNEAAASIGWPLPHPETASPLMLRKYDRKRFPPGLVTSNRLEAAILAPGDFPDVDTSVEPPVYKVAHGSVPIPTVVTIEMNRLPHGVAITPPPSPPTARVPKVGDVVVVDIGGDKYASGPVESTCVDAVGDTLPLVEVRGGWWTLVAWVDMVGHPKAGA